jgi:putative flippase GtrA
VFAATITWQLNRVFTFRTLAGIRSLLSYITLTSAGAFINIGVYSIWIRAMGIDPVQVTFGVGIGSAVALVFNYGISRYIVFRKQMPSDPR